MTPTENYNALAENILRVKTFEKITVPDSLIKFLTFLYNDEEIEIVAQLTSGAKSAKAVSKKINRPVNEVEPILKSLTERQLIWGIDKAVSRYGIIPFYPFFYDLQMLRCDKQRSEGDNSKDEYYKDFIRLFKDFLDEFYLWMTKQDYVNWLGLFKSKPNMKKLKQMGEIHYENLQTLLSQSNYNNGGCDGIGDFDICKVDTSIRPPPYVPTKLYNKGGSSYPHNACPFMSYDVKNIIGYNFGRYSEFS